MEVNEPPFSYRHSQVALLVINVQRGLFGKSTPIYQGKLLLDNIHLLVDRPHLTNTQVIFIQNSDTHDLVEGSEEWQLHPQLHPLSVDRIMIKCHDNAFQETDLDGYLRSRNIRNIVVTGLLTHCCIKAT